MGCCMILESFGSFLQKIMMFTAYVNTNSSFPKPLTAKEESEYLQKFHAGDQKAKEILIHHNLRLVAHIVKKYSGTEEADDLISVGSLGLIKAINTYQEGHNTQFSTYAAKCIENEILMLLRVNKKHKNTISIEDALCSDDEDNDISIIDLTFSEDEDVEKNVQNSILSERIISLLTTKLSVREYQIMKMRYGLEGECALTQREVADKLGISRSYISRLEKKSIETLREYMTKQDYL